MGQEYNEKMSLIHIPSTVYDALVGPSSLWFFYYVLCPCSTHFQGLFVGPFPWDLNLFYIMNNLDLRGRGTSNFQTQLNTIPNNLELSIHVLK